MTRSLRIALLVNPFTLGMKWGEHAPELARELLGFGHTVRGFGAPPGAIPRSGSSPAGEGGDEPVGVAGFKPDAIVAYDALSPAAWLGARTARKLSVPLILVEAANGGAATGRGMVLQAVGRRLFGRYVRATANAVIALDAVAKERVLRAGFSPALVSVHPGGVDLNACRPGLTSGLILRHRVRGRILLYVGQLTENRGLETLVTAFANTVGQRDDWSLVFAGEGSARAALRAKIDRLGIGSRVQWVGAPREEELPGLLSASTLLAVPAVDDTVRGRNIPRALACGLPVLASDRPALRHFVEHDVTGLLAASGDVQAWTETLRIAAMSPESRRRWGLAARAVAHERYAWPNIARVFESAIEAERASVPSPHGGHVVDART
ncbi:MAG: glycosyltransferase [Planctomycetes bacterium]|nr:glycosyltransferase [Planctomycetota bacterium]